GNLRLLTGLTAVKAKATIGSNLAPNPGFEAGTAGQLPTDWRWQIKPAPTANALLTDQGARTGKSALRINACAGTDKQGRPAWPMIRSADIPARPGQAYKLTAWMRSETPDSKGVLAAQAWKKDTYSWSRQAQAAVGTEWREYELVFKFP